MEQKRVDNIRVEHAEIGFRNFSGLPGNYNPAGSRNFCVFFDPANAATLKNDGWNIRYLKPRDDGDEPKPYLQVSVGFKFPPKIVLITRKGKSELDEMTVNVLDFAQMENVDLVIRPYAWTKGNQSGIKAYLERMYITLKEDEFDIKYEDVPDSATSVMSSY